MIDFTTAMPLQDAVDQISRRTPMGNALSSAEWDAVPAEIRLRTMWAARLEDERMAASLQAKIRQFIAMEREKLAGGGEGVFMDRGLFIERMRQEFKKAGYRPDPKKKGTLQDFTSTRRLELIWQMNLDQAQGYAQWKTGQSDVALRMWPAMEFIRLENRLERRRWNVKWKALGGKFYPGPAEYPEGRMIALRNDPIWPALNRFGVPWKPFDWGSGMGTRNVGRREALALGVIKAGDPPQAPEKVPFNSGAEASLKGISPARRRAIEDAFLGDVEIEGDVIRLLPPQGGDAMSRARPRGIRKWQQQDAELDRTSRPPQTPDGRPLTEVITVRPAEEYPDLIAQAEAALTAANQIHQDGVLPDLQVVFRKVSRYQEDPALYKKSLGGGERVEINVDPATELPIGLVILHETGHLLDNLGLHVPTAARAYASNGQPELDALIKALRETSAVSRLAARYGEDADILERQELFARAYAQFIIEESDDALLKSGLTRFRKGEFEAEGFPRELHWNSTEFRSIKALMRALFKQAGWKGARG
jgi:hypothetical protein